MSREYTRDSYLNLSNSNDIRSVVPEKKLTKRQKRQLIDLKRQELAKLGVVLRGRKPTVLDLDEDIQLSNCDCFQCRYHLSAELNFGVTCPRKLDK